MKDKPKARRGLNNLLNVLKCKSKDPVNKNEIPAPPETVKPLLKQETDGLAIKPPPPVSKGTPINPNVEW